MRLGFEDDVRVGAGAIVDRAGFCFVEFALFEASGEGNVSWI